VNAAEEGRAEDAAQHFDDATNFGVSLKDLADALKEFQFFVRDKIEEMSSEEVNQSVD
jgi:hypothetical protein